MAKKLRPGQARVEFLASKAEILNLIKKGHSIKAVHEVFFEGNKITMAYITLRKFIKEPMVKIKNPESINSEKMTGVEAKNLEKNSDCKSQELAKIEQVTAIAIIATETSETADTSKIAEIAEISEVSEIAKVSEISKTSEIAEADESSSTNIIDVNEHKTSFESLKVDDVEIF